MSKVSKGEGDKDCKPFDISHSGFGNTTPTQCFVKECNICYECCVVPTGQIVVFDVSRRSSELLSSDSIQLCKLSHNFFSCYNKTKYMHYYYGAFYFFYSSI